MCIRDRFKGGLSFNLGDIIIPKEKEGGFYGYMPVDDMAVCSYHAELVQQHVTYFFFIAQAVIAVSYTHLE